MPAGLVGLVTGEAATARRLAKHPGVAAVTLTGSVATGRSAALLCARLGKPLQAELGGNNAAIILADCPVRDEARSLALAAFSFAGQRCTAIRRFIVERPVLDEFREVFVTAVESLRLGDPRDSLTEIGPLISRAAVERIQSLLSRAAAGGAAVLCGGKTPPGLEQGCWLTPAVVSGAAPDSEIVRSETFGPVAVILPADDLEDALAIANSVEHGLVASLHTGDDRARCRFCEAAEAGILKLASGPLAVHPDAPFGGWKASGFGPPEHGLWDRAFYTRPQAVYGWSERAD
jgi:acyl-CoA reductase-like NAD-dependent aldehyde dehydrogenase